MSRRLAALDFDNTIVDTNSDVVAISLVDSSLIPETTKRLYRSDGWTAYMQGIFKVLHENNIDQTVITNRIRKMKAVEGFCELIRELKDNLHYDIVIISDSNSYFINEWLFENNLYNYILKVFTNPAEFVDGVLKIEMYHLQDSCKLSTKNLCKGQVLEDFINKQRDNDVIYEKVVYIGDGGNDFCPMLRLNVNDVACARENFKCAELVVNAKEGKSFGENGEQQTVKANVCYWNNGNDILEFLKRL